MTNKNYQLMNGVVGIKSTFTNLSCSTSQRTLKLFTIHNSFANEPLFHSSCKSGNSRYWTKSTKPAWMFVELLPFDEGSAGGGYNGIGTI